MMDLFGGGMTPKPAAPSFANPMNPMQRMQMVMSAMQNPAAFVKQKFPDIPDQYMNNPSMIMQYLQRTRGITQQDIQNAQTQMQGATANGNWR